MSGDNPLRACPKVELAMVPSRGISFAWGTQREGKLGKGKEEGMRKGGKERRNKISRG